MIEPLSREVTPEVVQAYAEVAEDFNPIHFDDDAARAQGLPMRIAHGMISGGLLSRLLTRHHGEAWLRRGRLSIRFVRPVPVGSRVTARARPAGEGLEVWVELDDGSVVIAGEASLG